MRTVAVTLCLLVFATVAAAQQQSPSGELVYKQHCAQCHEGSLPRMPSREALRSVAPEHIEGALSSFSMRRQGTALTPAERRAVAEFLAGRSPGSYRAPTDAIAKDAYCAMGNAAALSGAFASWNGWGANARNTRFQTTEAAGLSADEVPHLRVKWAFGLPGVSASGSHVTVVDGRVFVGSRNGVVYALDGQTGCVAWLFEADAGVRSTPVVAAPAQGRAPAVFFGDAHAQVYALDAATGALHWKIKVDDHLDAMITGGVAFHDGRLHVPVSSIEEGSAVMPSYPCCTFRGSVVSLDAVSGTLLWKTYTIRDAPQRTTRNSAGTQLWGPSGAAIWSAPTLDPERNRLYVTTGDSYSNPPAPGSDAIMALAMDTGRILWTRQTLEGDAWNVACLEEPGPGRVNCPEDAGPDFDFGSSPILTTLGDGRRILLAGQKSGDLYGVNPDTGDIVWKRRVGEGGVLGGIEWGFAADDTVAYVSLSNAFEKPPGQAGGLVAVRIADGTILWSAPPNADTCRGRTGCTTGQPAAVTAIPGVVFSGGLDGRLRAYDTRTGTVIWDVDTAQPFETINGVPATGGSLNGPGAAVVGGMMFVTSGYSSLGFMAGNVLLAFSVDGR